MNYKNTLNKIQTDDIKVHIETILFQNKSLFAYFKGIENGLQSILNDETVKPIILDSILNQLPSQVKQLSEIKFFIHDNQDKIVDEFKTEWERQVKYVQSDVSFAELELVKNKLLQLIHTNNLKIERQKKEHQEFLVRKKGLKKYINDNKTKIIDRLIDEWENATLKLENNSLSHDDLNQINHKLNAILSQNKQMALELKQKQERKKARLGIIRRLLINPTFKEIFFKHNNEWISSENIVKNILTESSEKFSIFLNDSLSINIFLMRDFHNLIHILQELSNLNKYYELDIKELFIEVRGTRKSNNIAYPKGFPNLEGIKVITFNGLDKATYFVNSNYFNSNRDQNYEPRKKNGRPLNEVLLEQIIISNPYINLKFID